MSTVKAVNIQNPSSSTANLVLATDGSASVAGVGIAQGGRNRIINGGFDVWQRGTSFATAGYTADRWAVVAAGGQTAAASQQTFAVGNPIAGYEPTNFLRISWSGTPSGTFWLTQRVEDVRTFAGQTVTLSFWAKASSATSVLAPMIEQNFGSGGSNGGSVSGSAISLTTSWQRFSQTLSVPSISGKTVGTSSYLDVRPFNGGSSVNGLSIDIWGVQLEAGTTATPFEVKPYAQELRECQRYYFKVQAIDSGTMFASGFAGSSTNAFGLVPFPVQMRTRPTALETNGTASDYRVFTASGSIQCSSIPTFDSSTVVNGNVTFYVASGLTTGQGIQLRATNANPYLAWSAEL